MTIESPGEFWKDYELVDSGNFEKLERFGKYYLSRPEPKALWDKTLSDDEWKRLTHTRFKPGAGFARAGKEDSGTWERLKKMGKWLKRYGESIYGTRGGDIPPHDWGVTTRKGNILYVHILDLGDDALYLPLDSKVVSARCLNDGSQVEYDVIKGKGILLHINGIPYDTDRIVELTLR